MKINLSERSVGVTIDRISIGACFRHVCSKERNILYMRIEDCLRVNAAYPKEVRNCVNLKNGHIESFNTSVEFEIVDAVAIDEGAK